VITTVVFDVGETLIDETRFWGSIADRLGIPQFTFFAVFGATIERRIAHSAVFEILGVDRGDGRETFDDRDYYADAVPCLARLRAGGYRLGLAGNQPEGHEKFFRESGTHVDFVGSSGAWGVEKPAAEFFTRLAEEAAVAPSEIAYVGDRIDNDVAPAARAGMFAVFLRRGPWAYLQADWPEAELAGAKIDSLDDLPQAIRDA
jgi:FMN phosphatase YigB (HAD superfamily)